MWKCWTVWEKRAFIKLVQVMFGWNILALQNDNTEMIPHKRNSIRSLNIFFLLLLLLIHFSPRDCCQFQHLPILPLPGAGPDPNSPHNKKSQLHCEHFVSQRFTLSSCRCEAEAEVRVDLCQVVYTAHHMEVDPLFLMHSRKLGILNADVFCYWALSSLCLCVRLCLLAALHADICS